MTDGHGVSGEWRREDYTRRILTQVEAGNGVSQRSLARSTGIALGLTNLLLKRLIRKGWVRMIHIKPNRVRYLMTPAGLAEKARMSRAYFAYTTKFYAEARDRIRERFQRLAADWPVAPAAGDGARPVIFMGTGEVAEIGFICLQETALRLVACVSDDPAAPASAFLGLPVHPVSWLTSPDVPAGAVVVVMAFGDGEVQGARAHLSTAGVPPDRIFYI